MKKKLLHIIREDNFLSLAGNLVIAFFGLAGFALLARSFGANEFGQWVLFLSAGSFMDMFRFGITNTGLIRFLSGADEKAREQYIGANAIIGFGFTTIIAGLIFICNLIFHESLQHSGYAVFFRWYPLLAFINLPWNNALVVLQADRRYGSMLLLKSLNSIPFFILLLFHTFYQSLTLTQLVWALLIINALTSAISLWKGWDGLLQWRKANSQARKTLLQFGKYTTFTLVGTNLLRSADTLIISLSPMGSAAVALYSIPLKLTELQQIPLRSFTATAFPKMSKASLQGNHTEVKNYFYSYTGALTFLFVFGGILSFVLAGFLVQVLGGSQYAGTEAVNIMRILSVYGLLLPLDRMTGIALDSINKPQVNAVKVFYMVAANIIGDILAVFVFHSLLLVAAASILFTLVGIRIGMRFLDRELQLSFREIFSSGAAFYKTQFEKVFYKSKPGLIRPS